MLRVIIGGDFAPIRRAEELLCAGKGSVLLGDLNILFRDADLVISNLECPLISRNSPNKEKEPILGAKVSCAKGLKSTGIDIFGLANNHILDHGTEGLNSTIRALKSVDIDYVGAGNSIGEAKQIFVKEIGSVKLGIMAFAENEFSIASKKCAGANPLDIIDFVRTIEKYKKIIDFIVVLFHGGKEYYPYPSPRQLSICRFMVEQGVNAVICQHSHCPGCYEEYQGGYIVYGQGNLLFDMYPDKMPAVWYEGFLVNLGFKKNAPVEFSITLYKQSNTEVGRHTIKYEEMNCYNQIVERSQRIQVEGFVDTEWYNFCKKKRYEYLSYIHGYSRMLRFINKRVHFSKYLFSNRTYNQILNVIRCETHREILETILKNRDTKFEKIVKNHK